jgi:hypothetical protein
MDYYNKQTYLGNGYVYSLDAAEPATTSEFPVLLLKNPTITAVAFPAQGTNVYPSLFVKFLRILCETASQSVILRVYLNPTVTAVGTVKTPVNLRIASPNTSVSALSINPTVSSNGKLVSVLASSAFTPSSGSELLVLDPGQSLLLTAQASSNTTLLGLDVHWYEM